MVWAGLGFGTPSYWIANQLRPKLPDLPSPHHTNRRCCSETRANSPPILGQQWFRHTSLSFMKRQKTPSISLRDRFLITEALLHVIYPVTSVGIVHHQDTKVFNAFYLCVSVCMYTCIHVHMCDQWYAVIFYVTQSRVIFIENILPPDRPMRAFSWLTIDWEGLTHYGWCHP